MSSRFRVWKTAKRPHGTAAEPLGNHLEPENGDHAHPTGSGGGYTVGAPREPVGHPSDGNLPSCPIHGPLPGLGTFCWDCNDYVDRLGISGQDTDGNGAAPPSPPGGALDLFPDERLEKEIQAGVRRVLLGLGFEVYWLSQARAPGQTAGLGDLYVVGHGVCAWLEIKRPGEGQRESQIKFQWAVEENGGTYVVLHSEQEAMSWALQVLEREKLCVPSSGS